MTDFAFLHGGGQGGWVWDETIAAMAAQSSGNARCLALDVPGCGAKRGRDASGMAFDAIAPELVADIEAAGMRDVVLVGHSQAGTLLPAMAAQRPDLWRRVVFVSCIVPDDGLSVLEMTGQRVHDGNSLYNDASLSMRERFRALFCNDMAPAQAEAFLDKLGPDNWPASSYASADWSCDHLAGIPVSYVLCLQDVALPLAWQERFAGRAHADRLVRIDAAHQVMNTRPQALAEVLLAEAAG